MIILLVDDEPSDAFLVRHLLARHDPDFTLLEATSCEETLAIVAKQTIDCIVMDQRLVGTSGSDCIKQLRENHYVGAFILLTGFADERTAVEAMKNGADDFLSKDHMHDELPMAIAKAIERRAEAVRMQIHAQEQDKRTADIIEQMNQLLAQLKQHHGP